MTSIRRRCWNVIVTLKLFSVHWQQTRITTPAHCPAHVPRRNRSRLRSMSVPHSMVSWASTSRPSLSLKLVGECGTDLRAWPSAKHFTSWLCLAPGNKISGSKILSSHTRRSSSRAAALLRLAAVTIGRIDTALGAFYRRLAARPGKAKAVTATARKITVLFYNTLRHGMAYTELGTSHYEEHYRNRVLGNLKRRAKSLGYDLRQKPDRADIAVS